MRMYDIIHKKRNGEELSKEEISFFIDGYVKNEIPDYQAAALMMAVYFKGMTAMETANLTMIMANSGDVVDLSSIEGIKVDKHSTGGVGDKTSLIIGPIAAACGVKIAKMSGRGLGHTGGTVDKMESIKGLKTSLSRKEFIDTVNKTGISIIGQSGNLCPGDKKLYALRDVTATVESIPLIASSIMSKKIAAGSDKILLDVKMGSGAFMKTMEDSIELATAMVEIGENVGRKTVALITNMNKPLGKNIGNSLEIIEVVNTLKGHGSKDLTDLCIELAANMIYLGQLANDLESAREMAIIAVNTGAAFCKFKEMVIAQGGSIDCLDNTNKFKLSSKTYDVNAPISGFVSSLNAESCGIAAVVLGAGRETKDSVIDYGAGIVLNKNVGDKVEAGELIATLYSESEQKNKAASTIILAALNIESEKPKEARLICHRVERA